MRYNGIIVDAEKLIMLQLMCIISVVAFCVYVYVQAIYCMSEVCYAQRACALVRRSEGVWFHYE